MNTWSEIVGTSIGLIGLFILFLGISYGIWYILVSVVFWAFGPVLFGYVFSHKIVVGCWVTTIILRQVFSASKS